MDTRVLQVALKPPFTQNCIIKNGVMMTREVQSLCVTDTPILCIRVPQYKPLKEVPPNKISIVDKRLKKWEMCNERDTLMRYVKLHYKISGTRSVKKIKHMPIAEIQEIYHKLQYLWNVPSKLLPLLGPINMEIEEGSLRGDIENISATENMTRYIKYVYPNVNIEQLERLTEYELTNFFNSFDVYYNLPGVVVRNEDDCRIATNDLKSFKPETNRNFSVAKKIISMSYIEVSYFSKTPASNASSYKSNHMVWYPMSGTGLFFPIENPIIATNKIHAMKLLGCSDELILKHSGGWFQYFVQKYSKNTWEDMKKINPTLKSKNIITKTRVFIKIPAQRPTLQGCYEEYDITTIEIKYIKEILTKIINDVIEGKVLKCEVINGNPILIKYDVLLDSGMNHLLRAAKKKNITTILLINDINISTQHNKVITTSEIIHIKSPSISQLYIARLNPLNPKVKSYTNMEPPKFPFPYENRKYIITNNTDAIKFSAV